jgi:hypothetical protein
MQTLHIRGPPNNAGVNPTNNAGVNPTNNAGVNPTNNAGVNPTNNAGVNPTHNARSIHAAGRPFPSLHFHFNAEVPVIRQRSNGLQFILKGVFMNGKYSLVLTHTLAFIYLLF